MSKLLIFGLLFWLICNPFVAIFVLMVILYALDRRFVGMAPNLFKPLQRSRRLRRLRQELVISPHQTSLKLEVVRILIEKRKYSEANVLLNELTQVIEDSAEVWFESGLCRLRQGNFDEGEAHMLKALELNPRVRYGEPYLRLGEAFSNKDQIKALFYLRQFQDIHSSSCEAYYRLGQILENMEQQKQASEAYRETVSIYRSLPKYKRKSERRWAFLASMKNLLRR